MPELLLRGEPRRAHLGQHLVVAFRHARPTPTGEPRPFRVLLRRGNCQVASCQWRIASGLRLLHSRLVSQPSQFQHGTVERLLQDVAPVVGVDVARPLRHADAVTPIEVAPHRRRDSLRVRMPVPVRLVEPLPISRDQRHPVAGPRFSATAELVIPVRLDVFAGNGVESVHLVAVDLRDLHGVTEGFLVNHSNVRPRVFPRHLVLDKLALLQGNLVGTAHAQGKRFFRRPHHVGIRHVLMSAVGILHGDQPFFRVADHAGDGSVHVDDLTVPQARHGQAAGVPAYLGDLALYASCVPAYSDEDALDKGCEALPGRPRWLFWRVATQQFICLVAIVP